MEKLFFGFCGGEERCIQGFGGAPERLHGKPRRRFKNNIKMDLKVGWSHVLDCLAEDRDMWRAIVNAVMNLW